MGPAPERSAAADSALKAAKGAWPELIASSVLLNVLSLALPLVLMQVYDRVIGARSMGTMAWLALGCLAALALEGVLRLVRSDVCGWQAARFEHLAGCEALGRILGARPELFERLRAGEYLERLNAAGRLRNFYSGQVFQHLIDLPFAALFLVVMAFLGGWLVLVPLAAGALFFLLVSFSRERYRRAGERLQESGGRRFSHVIEVVGRLHLVKARTMEELMLRRHETLQAAASRDEFDQQGWSALPGTLGSVLSQAAMFGVILAGGSLVISGAMTVGQLTACMILAVRAMDPIQQLAGWWMRLAEAELAARHLEEVRGLEPRPRGRETFPDDIEGRLDLEQVRFRYAPDRPEVLAGLDLRIEPRTMVGLGGPPQNGSTTLLHLMMGHLRPTSGRVLLDWTDLSAYDADGASARIGYIPRHGVLFKADVVDNLTCFDPRRHHAAMDTAAMLGLDELVSALPKGYKTELSPQSSRVPAKLAMLVTVARVLATRPRVLLLDKTSASMDFDTEKLFLELVERLRGQATMVLVTQWPRLLESCDRAYELKDGVLAPWAAGRRP